MFGGYLQWNHGTRSGSEKQLPFAACFHKQTLRFWLRLLSPQKQRSRGLNDPQSRSTLEFMKAFHHISYRIWSSLQIYSLRLFPSYKWKNEGWERWDALPSTRSTAKNEKCWNSEAPLNPDIYVWWLWPTQILLQTKANHLILHLGFYPALPTRFPTLSSPLHIGPL